MYRFGGVHRFASKYKSAAFVDSSDGEDSETEIDEDEDDEDEDGEGDIGMYQRDAPEKDGLNGEEEEYELGIELGELSELDQMGELDDGELA